MCNKIPLMISGLRLFSETMQQSGTKSLFRIISTASRYLSITLHLSITLSTNQLTTVTFNSIKLLNLVK